MGVQFVGHFRHLSSVNIDNVYLSDSDIFKIFTLDPQGESKYNTKNVSLRYLQNHSDLTLKGLSSLACNHNLSFQLKWRLELIWLGVEHLIGCCPNLSSLAITFIGGSVNFPCCVITEPMVHLISQVTYLKNLELFIELSSLSLISKMTTLESLSLKFKPNDVVKYQPPKVKSQANSIPTPVPVQIEKQLNPSLEFSLFSQSLSSNLKVLYLENTCSPRSGQWDISGLCEGLQNLESLTLCYMPEGTKMNKPWSGQSLKGIFILRFEFFFLNYFSTRNTLL